MALQGFVASWVTKNERARKLRAHLCGNTLRTNPAKCQPRDSSWRLDAGPLLRLRTAPYGRFPTSCPARPRAAQRRAAPKLPGKGHNDARYLRTSREVPRWEPGVRRVPFALLPRFRMSSSRILVRFFPATVRTKQRG